MKKLIVLLLVFTSTYTYAQTKKSICWGAILPIDAGYVLDNDDENITQKIQETYTSKYVVGIYKNINKKIMKDLGHKESMCALLWPYFTFIMNSTYKQKEFVDATQAFIEIFGTEPFIAQLNNLDKKLKILPVLKGFNGKDKANDNQKDYDDVASSTNNQVFINLMNGNEKIFLSLKTYLKYDGISLNDLTVEDLFGLLEYLNKNGQLDLEYFPELDTYKKDILEELNKVND